MGDPIDLNASLDSDVSEEMLCFGDGDGDSDDNAFDEIVGALENILMDDEFLNLQNDFCESNCEVFQDDDENKLVYTDLFSSYTEMIEGYIVIRLGNEIEVSSFAQGYSFHRPSIVFSNPLLSSLPPSLITNYRGFQWTSSATCYRVGQKK